MKKTVDQEELADRFYKPEGGSFVLDLVAIVAVGPNDLPVHTFKAYVAGRDVFFVLPLSEHDKFLEAWKRARMKYA